MIVYSCPLRYSLYMCTILQLSSNEYFGNVEIGHCIASKWYRHRVECRRADNWTTVVLLPGQLTKRIPAYVQEVYVRRNDWNENAKR